VSARSLQDPSRLKRQDLKKRSKHLPLLVVTSNLTDPQDHRSTSALTNIRPELTTAINRERMYRPGNPLTKRLGAEDKAGNGQGASTLVNLMEDGTGVDREHVSQAPRSFPLNCVANEDASDSTHATFVTRLDAITRLERALQ